MSNVPPKEVTAVCPSCEQPGTFDLAGVQPVLPPVARKMGLDGDCIVLWHCPNCNSTISDNDLKQKS